MKILYAEDEKALSMAVTEILKIENYDVTPVYDGQQALESINNTNYDIIVLDIMMPKLSGLEVLQKIRQNEIYTPVLLLTAKAEVEDRIEGLSVGADDYLAKPFAMTELIARLNAMFRRISQYKIKEFKFGNTILNCDTLELKSNVGSLRLSNKEFELLSLLMKNNQSKFNINQIMERIWKDSSDNNTVILYISYLKNKLKQIHSTMDIIKDNDYFYIIED